MRLLGLVERFLDILQNLVQDILSSEEKLYWRKEIFWFYWIIYQSFKNIEDWKN